MHCRHLLFSLALSLTFVSHHLFAQDESTTIPTPSPTLSPTLAPASTLMTSPSPTPPEPTIIPVIHSSYNPLTSYNNITPENNSSLKVEIQTDQVGNYHSIVAFIPDTVINRPVTDDMPASDNLLCGLNSEDARVCVGGHHAIFEILGSAGLERFPYQAVQINWNPQGHPPMFFEANHFDFHFHRQTFRELQQITQGGKGDGTRSCNIELISCVIGGKATRELEPEYLPANYTNSQLITAVPWMGTHLIHVPTIPASADNFTKVLIHRAWDGKLSFQEPMITVEYFNTLKQLALSAPSYQECFDIPQPQKYPDDKVYPRQWCASYLTETSTFRVSLTDFPAHINATSAGYIAKARLLGIIIFLTVTRAVVSLI